MGFKIWTIRGVSLRFFTIALKKRARKGGIGSAFRLQNKDANAAGQAQNVVNEFPDINKITADLRAACDARELANKRVWSFPLN